jgi:hypothetical protein
MRLRVTICGWILFFGVVLLLVFSCPISAENRFSLELFLGGALNLRTPLTIEQEGYETIEFDARYESKAFEPPLYYTIRFTYLRSEGGWEFQFIHHKIYLENTTDEVQYFEVTHGYNIFTINYSYRSLPADLRAGAGIILARPEAVVRGRTEMDDGIGGSGYHLTGPALVIGAGKAFPFASSFSFAFDMQITLARAVFPIPGGEASAPNVALHLMLGIGYSF